jgi:hypothetical protein
MGRKQPVAAPPVALRKLSDQGRSGSQLFRYPYGSVAAIQRKIVAAIIKIWRTQPGAAVAFVASVSESHTMRLCWSLAASPSGRRARVRPPHLPGSRCLTGLQLGGRKSRCIPRVASCTQVEAVYY